MLKLTSTLFINSFLAVITLISQNLLAQNLLTATALPHVTNNAVTQLTINNKPYLLSFSGLAAGKTYRDVHNLTYIYDVKKKTWQQGAPVPIEEPVNGHTGRLASVAVAIKGVAYIFGGYTVEKNHNEVSVPDVYSYHVLSNSYTQLKSMPVPVDDSVALTYQQRYIYLISGWHNDGNVNLVQVYDTQTNSWQQASPFPGKAVFGHAGGIIGNTMLICDGVRVDVHLSKKRTYTAEAACYRGIISPKTPYKIAWNKVNHPSGISRYRMAANGFIDNKTQAKEIVFIGGSDNPYNYSGIGYNGKPAEPSDQIWRYNIEKNQWSITQSDSSTMDHRGLLKLDDKLITIGGMSSNQQVLNTINQY